MALFFTGSTTSRAGTKYDPIATWRRASWETQAVGSYDGNGDVTPVGDAGCRATPGLSARTLNAMYGDGVENRLLFGTADPGADTPPAPHSTYKDTGSKVFGRSTPDEGLLAGKEFGDGYTIIKGDDDFGSAFPEFGGNVHFDPDNSDWCIIGTYYNDPGPDINAWQVDYGEQAQSLGGLNGVGSATRQGLFAVHTQIGLTLTPFRVPELDRRDYGPDDVDAAQITISVTEIKKMAVTVVWSTVDGDPSYVETPTVTTSFSGTVGMVGIESDGTLHILKTGGGAATLSAGSNIPIDGTEFIKQYLRYKDLYYYFALFFLPGTAGVIDAGLDPDVETMLDLRNATAGRLASFDYVEETEWIEYHPTGTLTRSAIAFKNPTLVGGNVTFNKGPGLAATSRVFHGLPPDMT